MSRNHGHVEVHDQAHVGPQATEASIGVRRRGRAAGAAAEEAPSTQLGKKQYDQESSTTKKAVRPRKQYDKELAWLAVELVKLQEWIKREGLWVMVIFKGRDAAGKGGVIKLSRDG
jgi:polyphosphate kinase 2 (PPK2 family)